MASITSRHLTASDKGRVFGICIAGSHLGYSFVVYLYFSFITNNISVLLFILHVHFGTLTVTMKDLRKLCRTGHLWHD